MVILNKIIIFDSYRNAFIYIYNYNKYSHNIIYYRYIITIVLYLVYNIRINI